MGSTCPLFLIEMSARVSSFSEFFEIGEHRKKRILYTFLFAFCVVVDVAAFCWFCFCCCFSSFIELIK